MMSFHFAESARRNAANSSDAIGRGSRPRRCTRLRQLGRPRVREARSFKGVDQRKQAQCGFRQIGFVENIRRDSGNPYPLSVVGNHRRL
jgi:hypothetical protein